MFSPYWLLLYQKREIVTNKDPCMYSRLRIRGFRGLGSTRPVLGLSLPVSQYNPRMTRVY